jgi:hypothetical protein
VIAAPISGCSPIFSGNAFRVQAWAAATASPAPADGTVLCLRMAS